MVTIIKPDFIHEDDRGSLVQLVRKGYSQFNVIKSISGTIRGGHYHEINKEAFYIIEGELKLEVSMCDITEEYDFKAGDMFEIDPFVLHSFIFKTNTLLVSMYDKGVELGENMKDIITPIL